MSVVCAEQLRPNSCSPCVCTACSFDLHGQALATRRRPSSRTRARSSGFVQPDLSAIYHSKITWIAVHDELVAALSENGLCGVFSAVSGELLAFVVMVLVLCWRSLLASLDCSRMWLCVYVQNQAANEVVHCVFFNSKSLPATLLSCYTKGGSSLLRTRCTRVGALRAGTEWGCEVGQVQRNSPRSRSGAQRVAETSIHVFTSESVRFPG